MSTAKRKSVLSLVQGYLEDQGADTTRLLNEINSGGVQTTSVEESVIAVKPAAPVELKSVIADTPVIQEQQIIGQATEQASNRATEQATEQASNRATEQAEKQATGQLSRQPIEQLSRQPSKQTPGQATEQPYEQATEQPGEKYLWLPLNMNQGRILVFLYELGTLTNMDLLCKKTGVAYGTARRALDVLGKEGYIISKKQHNGHSFKGFEYTLNNHLCSLYVSRIRGEQASEQVSKQPGKQASNRATGPFSSSVFKEETLTTTGSSGILNDPELCYWKGEGVTEKQVKDWMAEFKLTQDEMIMSLRYGRFDILERGNIDNADGWFYKILIRKGFYPAPANYKSLTEIKAEAIKQQQERDRAAEAELAELELKIRFKEFLADKQSPLYLDLASRLTSFAADCLRDGDSQHAEIELFDMFAALRGGEY